MLRGLWIMGSIARFPRGLRRPEMMETMVFDANVDVEEVSPEPLCFVVGRDQSGHWIVQETHGLCGGLFRTEDAAIRYAKFESADRKSVIRHSSHPLALNCSS
jgi:hypothetical protein